MDIHSRIFITQQQNTSPSNARTENNVAVCSHKRCPQKLTLSQRAAVKATAAPTSSGLMLASCRLVYKHARNIFS